MIAAGLLSVGRALWRRPWVLLVAGVALLAGVQYCRGRSAGRAVGRVAGAAATFQAARPAIVAAVDSVRARAATAAAVSAAAVSSSDGARAATRPARSRVQIAARAGDTLALVDGRPVSLPLAVADALRGSAALIAADSVSIASLLQEVRARQAERDAERAARALAEATLVGAGITREQPAGAAIPPPGSSRCGTRCRVVIGAVVLGGTAYVGYRALHRDRPVPSLDTARRGAALTIPLLGGAVR